MKTLLADGVKMATTIDKGARITFETGEYQVDDALELFRYAKDVIASGKPLRVSVEEE
jgi:hypothetical protein